MFMYVVRDTRSLSALTRYGTDAVVRGGPASKVDVQTRATRVDGVAIVDNIR